MRTCQQVKCGPNLLVVVAALALLGSATIAIGCRGASNNPTRRRACSSSRPRTPTRTGPSRTHTE
jgi:hypothetical protein